MSGIVLQCVETIHREGRWSGARCGRKGSVEREGKMYCKQHDPVARKERAAAKYAEWTKRFAQKCEVESRKRELLNICQGLTIEQVKAAIEKLKP